jgi:hypothetical protein
MEASVEATFASEGIAGTEKLDFHAILSSNVSSERMIREARRSRGHYV